MKHLQPMPQDIHKKKLKQRGQVFEVGKYEGLVFEAVKSGYMFFPSSSEQQRMH